MRYDIKSLVAAIPLGDLVGRYVKLKRSGVDDLVGLCPFHREKSPSLHVHPGEGFFKCFGCGVGGDAISFYARIEDVSTADAIKHLAEEWGFDLGSGKKALPPPPKLPCLQTAGLFCARRGECPSRWSCPR